MTPSSNDNSTNASARTTTSFSRFAQFSARDMAIGSGTDAHEMRIGVVSASFFGFFDAPPITGRYFTTAEDSTPNGSPVAVLSYNYWRSEYGSRNDALGTTIRLGPLVYTVIGVAPARFAGLWPDQTPVAYIPLSSYAGTQGFSQKGKTWWTTYNWTWSPTIAQRKPGVSEVTANTDLSTAFVRSYEQEIADEPLAQPITLVKPRAMIGSILTERGPNEFSLAKVAT